MTDRMSFYKTDGIGVITIDAKDRQVNVLDPKGLQDLAHLIDQIDGDKEIDAAVIISSKRDNFLAGADINLLATIDSESKGEKICLETQKIFKSITRSKKPFIAAINGGCFGGGLELALACHFRIASREPETMLAFPEVKLGLLPAAGGTQMLIRMMAFANALDMLLAGRKIHAVKAKKLGLVDELVNKREELLSSSIGFARDVQKKDNKKGLKRPFVLWALASLYFAKRKIEKKTHGHYPAPLAIIETIRHGLLKGYDEGLLKEARCFGELSQTLVSKNLIRLFLLQKERQKNPLVKDDSGVRRIGIVGSGLMGSGIAHVSLRADLGVNLIDKVDKALAKARSFILKELDKDRGRDRLTRSASLRKASLLTTTTDLAKLKDCDLIIEAIAEELDAKRDLLQKLEEFLPHSVFASNTSSLAIKDIAKGFSMVDRIIGMHYFSPVAKVPLLEIVKTMDTRKEVLAKAFDIGAKQKRTMIVVNDSPGFFTTRVISTLFDEACLLLLEGHEPHAIDHGLIRLGFPVGPIKLMDEVGIDIGLHVSKNLHKHFGDRLIAADLSLCEQMVSRGFLGRKSGRGFYEYDGKRHSVNHDVKKLLTAMKKPVQGGQPEERMLLRMVNEAALCFVDGVIESVEDGDVAGVFGIGFPPYLGGPFRYIDQIGKKAIGIKLESLKKKLGIRFEKAPIFG